MSEHLALLSKFQAAQKAVDDLAQEGHRAAKEHEFAIDHLRSELCAIDDLCRAILGPLPDSTLSAVSAVIDLLKEERRRNLDLASTVARLEDADRLLRQSHVALSERCGRLELENVRLREEVAAQKKALDENAATFLRLQGGRP